LVTHWEGKVLAEALELHTNRPFRLTQLEAATRSGQSPWMICMDLDKGWSNVRPFCPTPFRFYLDPVKAKEAKVPLLQSHWGEADLHC
jgi:hypothetical protein